ncbi:hypothetical protein LR69_02064 [Geobacillus sp. BCO2]|nr:hypothetical protein LR69_02064 [Geobacillus sp. BCO2]
MKAIIAVIATVVLLLLLVAWMKVSVTLVFRHMKDDDECKIVVRTLFGLIRYTVRIPLIKVDMDSDAPGVAFLHKKEWGDARKRGKERKSDATKHRRPVSAVETVSPAGRRLA